MPIFIGICGGSSSGKTTISDYLVKNIQNSSQMCLDDYTKILNHDAYKDREDFIKHHNFGCPDAYNINLLVHHLKELNNGNDIEVPIYSHKTSTYVGAKLMKPTKYIILDGILLFAIPQILQILDVKVFVNSNQLLRNERRISRDIIYRGADLEMVKTQLETSVNPMHDKYIEPNKYYADIYFDNTENINEHVLKSKMSNLQDQILTHYNNKSKKIYHNEIISNEV